MSLWIANGLSLSFLFYVHFYNLCNGMQLAVNQPINFSPTSDLQREAGEPGG